MVPALVLSAFLVWWLWAWGADLAVRWETLGYLGGWREGLVLAAIVGVVGTGLLVFGVARSSRVPPASTLLFAGIPLLTGVAAFRALAHGGERPTEALLWEDLARVNAYRALMEASLVSTGLLLGAALALTAVALNERETTPKHLAVGFASAIPVAMFVPLFDTFNTFTVALFGMVATLATATIVAGAAQATSRRDAARTGLSAVVAGGLSTITLGLFFVSAVSHYTLKAHAGHDDVAYYAWGLPVDLLHISASETAGLFRWLELSKWVVLAIVLILVMRLVLARRWRPLVSSLLGASLLAGATVGVATVVFTHEAATYAAIHPEPWYGVTPEFTPVVLERNPVSAGWDAIIWPTAVSIRDEGLHTDVELGGEELSDWLASRRPPGERRWRLELALDARLDSRELRAVLRAAERAGATEVVLLAASDYAEHVDAISEIPGAFRYIPGMRQPTGVLIEPLSPSWDGSANDYRLGRVRAGGEVAGVSSDVTACLEGDGHLDWRSEPRMHLVFSDGIQPADLVAAVHRVTRCGYGAPIVHLEAPAPPAGS